MPLPRFRRRSPEPPTPDEHADGASTPAGSDDVGASAGPGNEETAADTSAADEALLTTPLDDADLNERLLAASGSGRARSTTVLLVIVVFVLGLALGGAAGSAAADIRAAIAAQLGDDEEPVPPPEALVDGRLHGTIRVVDGDTVLVDVADGTTVRVDVTTTTRVATAVPGDLDDLRPGAEVTISGEAMRDGAVRAAEIVDHGRD
jgi:hypothetical protein